MLSAKLQSVNGVPTLFINGKPNTGAMYWRGSIPTEDSRLFAAAGVNCYSFNSQLWMGDAPDGTPAEYCDGQLCFPAGTPERIDEQMEAILAGNPNALVMPRFRVIAPTWWVDEHPAQMMRLYDWDEMQFVQGKLPAIDSPEWLKIVEKGLADTVRYCEKKWGEHILAYHTGMGACAEHSYEWGRSLVEYSAPHRDAFRIWLKQKYGTDEALRAAWQRNDVNIGNADFPEPERYLAYLTKGRVFFDIEKDADLADQQLFNSWAMGQAVVFQAKVIKNTLRELQREKLYCAFYGYMDISSGSFTKWAHGHDGQEAVLNCSDVDIICAPLNYSARQQGGGVNAQVLPGSMALHNKIYYAEDDTGTHKAHDHHGYIPRTALEATQLLRRNFLGTLSTGGSQWWMDLRNQDWYHDADIMNEVKWQSTFAEEHLADRRSRAEIAVFISEKSRNYDVIFPTWYMGQAIEQQLNEMSGVGAPYDVFRLEDLPLLVQQKRLAQYKFALLLNATFIDAPLAEVIKKELLSDGRTVLWFYMPGYIRDGKANSSFSRELTGMMLKDVISNDFKSMLTETWIDGMRICYGQHRCAIPRFACSDSEKEAERLGYYIEGTMIAIPANGDGASLLSKKMPWGRSIWSSSSLMPSALITKFAREAGVHIYCEGTPVWVGNDWIAIHAKRNGNHIIHLRDKDISLSLHRGDTRLFQKSLK